MTRAAGYVPALLTFPPESARQDAWGRFTRLTAGGAELSTGVRLVRGEGVFLAFELGGRSFDGIRARVDHAEDDADGRRLVELVFLDQLQSRELAKVLIDVLSR